MSGHGNLPPRSKDSDPDRGGAAWCGKHESRLAEVHLASEALHLGGLEPAGIMKHRKLISAERTRAEHIDQGKRDSRCHRAIVSQSHQLSSRRLAAFAHR